MKSKEPERQSKQPDEVTASAENDQSEIKTAFFITPLGQINSEIRRATDGIINAVIRPVLEKHKLVLTPPHEILEPGNITKQIISQILNSDLVIANLTGLNANVMYELAVRHATRKPVIVIADKVTTLPFDIAAERTVFYDNDMAGAVQLSKELDLIIPRALADKEPDNPIYSGVQASLIQDLVKNNNNSLESYVIEKLDKIDELTSIVKSLSNLQKNNKDSFTPYYNPKAGYNISLYKYTLTATKGIPIDAKEITSKILNFLPKINDIRYFKHSDSEAISFEFLVKSRLSEMEVDNLFKISNADEINVTQL